MLPLVLGGLLVAGKAISNHCSLEVNEGYERELNSINKEMQSMKEKVDELVVRTSSAYEGVMESLSKQRKDIYSKTFVQFKKVTDELKNVEINNKQITFSRLRELDSMVVSYIDTSSYRAHRINTTAVAVAGVFTPPGLFTLSSMIKGVKLMTAIDEAKTEKSKLAAKCKKIEIQCTSVYGLARYLNSAYETIDMLNNLVVESTRNTKRIIDNCGCDFRKYEKKDKEAIMTMYNLVFALNDISSVQIIDEEGRVNEQFRKYIGEVEKDHGMQQSVYKTPIEFKGNKYSEETKKAVQERLLAGTETISEISLDTGISKSTLCSWRCQAYENQ